jgi:hypothetical protein
MTIDEGTGDISWTPRRRDRGVHPVIVRVTDEDGAVDDQTFTIQVTKEARANEPDRDGSDAREQGRENARLAECDDEGGWRRAGLLPRKWLRAYLG